MHDLAFPFPLCYKPQNNAAVQRLHYLCEDACASRLPLYEDSNGLVSVEVGSLDTQVLFRGLRTALCVCGNIYIYMHCMSMCSNGAETEGMFEHGATGGRSC